MSLRDEPIEQLLLELNSRASLTNNIEAMSTLVMVEEAFQQSLPPATAAASPTAQPAPQAPSAQQPPVASAAPVAASAPEAEKAPGVRVSVPPGSPIKLQDAAWVAQNIIRLYVSGNLPPLATRLMECAAQATLLEQVKR